MKSPLHSISELYTILSRLKDGESLIISDGQFYTGKVPGNVKLKELDQNLPGKVFHALDGNGINEMFNTSSWVSSPGRTFKNMWDSMRVKLAKGGNFNPMYELFIEKMENLTPESAEGITCNVIESDSHRFLEVSLPDFPIIVGLNKSLTMRYYIFNGRKVLT